MKKLIQLLIQSLFNLIYGTNGKPKFQERLDNAVQKQKTREIYNEPHPKSKWQERLDEVNKKRMEETPSGDNALDNLNLHNWIDIKDEKPVYYAPVDIDTGRKIRWNYARVSDGERDYYVNSRDNHVVLNIKSWRKREGIVYPKYDPMTAKDHDPILSYYDMTILIQKLKDDYIDEEHKQYNLGVKHAIDTVKEFINNKFDNTK